MPCIPVCILMYSDISILITHYKRNCFSDQKSDGRVSVIFFNHKIEHKMNNFITANYKLIKK